VSGLFSKDFPPLNFRSGSFAKPQHLPRRSFFSGEPPFFFPNESSLEQFENPPRLHPLFFLSCSGDHLFLLFFQSKNAFFFPSMLSRFPPSLLFLRFFDLFLPHFNEGFSCLAVFSILPPDSGPDAPFWMTVFFFLEGMDFVCLPLPSEMIGPFFYFWGSFLVFCYLCYGFLSNCVCGHFMPFFFFFSGSERALLPRLFFSKLKIGLLSFATFSQNFFLLAEELLRRVFFFFLKTHLLFHNAPFFIPGLLLFCRVSLFPPRSVFSSSVPGGRHPSSFSFLIGMVSPPPTFGRPYFDSVA